MNKFPLQFIILLSLLWAGMILGVSFLATPVKFSAPSLTLPVGVDIGRHIFSIFDQAQWFILVLLIVVSLISPSRVKPKLLPLILFIQIMQSAWLLPCLNKLALSIIAGQSAQASKLHAMFGVAEACKLLLLISLAWLQLNSIKENSV